MISLVVLGLFISNMSLISLLAQGVILSDVIYYMVFGIPLILLIMNIRSPVDMTLVYNHPQEFSDHYEVLQYCELINYLERNQKTIGQRIAANMILSVHSKVK